MFVPSIVRTRRITVTPKLKHRSSKSVLINSPFHRVSPSSPRGSRDTPASSLKTPASRDPARWDPFRRLLPRPAASQRQLQLVHLVGSWSTSSTCLESEVQSLFINKLVGSSKMAVSQHF